MNGSPTHGAGPSLHVADGLAAFTGGIAFVFRTPRVWPYALVPAIMMLVVTAVLFALGLWGALEASGALLGEPESTWERVGGWLVTVLLALVALLVAVVVALGLAQPLSGFALEAIAHAQEKALTGVTTPEPSFLASFLHGLRVAAVTLVVGGSILAMLFVIELFFPPAAVIVAPIQFLVSAWLLAWDFVDYPLGIRHLGLRDRLGWVRRNLSAFTTFGVLWAILAVVPGVVVVLLSMGVAGATRLVVEDERRRRAAAPSSKPTAWRSA